MSIPAPGSLSFSFSFAQGSTERNFSGLNYLSNGGRDSYDLSSPIQFGSSLLLAAESQMGAFGYTFTDHFGASEGIAGNYGLSLDGYTVLDSAGNVIADAQVRPLSATPERGTWTLMLAGLGVLGMWVRFRRNRPLA